MKSNIYIIKNHINNKVYIGQTTKSIQKRFLKHTQDARFKTDASKRPLYQAMQKHGIQHFYVELIEVCDTKDADAREEFWIKHYNAYGSGGYNATIGGNSYRPYEYDDIAQMLQQGLGKRDIKAKLGCCPQLVARVAHTYNIPIPKSEIARPVVCCTINGEFIARYNSSAEAARAVYPTLSQPPQLQTVRKNIARCCHSPTHKTAYNYQWLYENDFLTIQDDGS